MGVDPGEVRPQDLDRRFTLYYPFTLKPPVILGWPYKNNINLGVSLSFIKGLYLISLVNYWKEKGSFIVLDEFSFRFTSREELL